MADEVEVEDAPPPPPVNARSDAALARHAQRMRPLRLTYTIVLAVLVAALIAIVVVVYERGEISHVTLHTVANPPSSVALQSPSNQLTSAWTSSDHTAIGTPNYNGTVVTYDTHTVRGRDGRTGKQTWSYTRTDRAVCTAIQDQGVTVAVYALHGNCDELTAVNSETGVRKWTRTLDKDGAEFDGPATFSVQPGNIMFVSRTSIYAVADQDNGGIDYWTFHHPGCTINGAVLGTGGALISQTCVNEHCDATPKYCGNGTQLLLRQESTGTNDDAKKNPDQIVWNRHGSDLAPVLAGHQIAARDPSTNKLWLLAAKSGVAKAELALATGITAPATSTFSEATDADLIWIGGRTYALKPDATAFAWQTDTGYVPTVTNQAGTSSAPLASGRVTVATSAGIAQLDGATGKARQTFSVTVPPPRSYVYPFGSGFVVAGSTTTVYK
jgi:hypothetical protein